MSPVSILSLPWQMTEAGFKGNRLGSVESMWLAPVYWVEGEVYVTQSFLSLSLSLSAQRMCSLPALTTISLLKPL